MGFDLGIGGTNFGLDDLYGNFQQVGNEFEQGLFHGGLESGFNDFGSLAEGSLHEPDFWKFAALVAGSPYVAGAAGAGEVGAAGTSGLEYGAMDFGGEGLYTAGSSGSLYGSEFAGELAAGTGDGGWINPVIENPGYSPASWLAPAEGGGFEASANTGLTSLNNPYDTSWLGNAVSNNSVAQAGMGLKDYLSMGAFGLQLNNYFENKRRYDEAKALQNQREQARQLLATQWADPKYRYDMLKNDPLFQATQDRIIQEQRRSLAARGVSSPLSLNYSTPMATALASNANAYQSNIFNQRAQAAGIQFNPGSTDVGLAQIFQPAISRSYEQSGQGLMASLGSMEQSGTLPRIFQTGNTSI